MSDDKGQQEPSMEDILASIRRILSEDDVEEPKPPAKAEPEAKRQPEPAPEPEPESPADDVFELTDDMVAAEPQREPEPEPEPAPEPDEALDMSAFEAEPPPGATLASESMFEPEQGLRPVRQPDAEPEPEPRAMFEPRRPDAAPMEEALIAPAVAEASTQALTELARAVARERGIGLGARGMTLEDLVRDILRPILKDWLDQNLPYMIERIVRKEIERMVNRAEKL